MSLRIYTLLLLLSLFFSCTRSEKKTDTLADLTQKERDSLSKYYFDLSSNYYQSSESHRIYRDSSLVYNPDNINYRERLSYSYKKTGEHIEAMRILNDAVERDLAEGTTFSLQYRAWSLLYFYRDYHGTIRDVDLIFDTLPETTNKMLGCHGEPCLLLKAQALYRLEKYQEAIELFQWILEEDQRQGFDPLDNHLAYFYLGRCYTELGAHEKAISFFEDQLAVYDTFTEAHFQLGKLYKELGNNEKATYHLQNALELFNKNMKMGEPYFERFDEVFLYQIEEELYP